MTSSELMPSEEPPRKPSSAKAFSLPEANVTEFSFPLSIHGAWMLEDGIMDYVETTMVMHEQGQQDDGYCAIRTATAVTEAKKLLVWAKQIDEEYLEGIIESFRELISKLNAEMDRFVALNAETRFGEENISGEDME